MPVVNGKSINMLLDVKCINIIDIRVGMEGCFARLHLVFVRKSS